MSRRFTIRGLTMVLAAAGILGWSTVAALAVTNPAANPNRIEVVGDDGNTYVDGQDTLPGFDDEACTYIPGAYFDFAKNRVHYPDGQSIPWTEWERASGYKDWLAKQASGTAVATTLGANNVNRSTQAAAIKAAQSSGEPNVAEAAPTPGIELVDDPGPASIAVPSAVVSPLPNTNPGRETGFAILGGLTALGALTYGSRALTSVTKKK